MLALGINLFFNWSDFNLLLILKFPMAIISLLSKFHACASLFLCKHVTYLTNRIKVEKNIGEIRIIITVL